MPTLAELWRQSKPKYYANFTEYLDIIHAHDPKGPSFQKTDLGVIITFSDGSQHNMSSKS